MIPHELENIFSLDRNTAARRQRKAPGEEWISTGALAFPGTGGVGGERRLTYKRRAPIAKGRSRVERFCAPAPLPKCPHTRKEKISNSDDEIAAGLGQEALRRIPADGRTIKGLSGWLRPATSLVLKCSRRLPIANVAHLRN